MARARDILAAALACALASPAFAQDAEPVVTAGDGSADATTPASPATATARGDDADAVLQSYAPDFFARFQPNTALDMVAQVPGFSLRGGGGGARGFGEADANFLINGRRPSTKGQDARDLLQQIPANTVVRVEILDGASLDLPGLSGQVVNVVARAVALSGSWEYAARFEEGTRPQLLEGELRLSGERGNLSFALGLDSGQFSFTEDSVEQFYSDRPERGGTLLEDRTEDIYFDNRRPVATLNLGWTPDNGHVANLNGRLQMQNRNNGIREVFTAVDPSRSSGRSQGDSGEDEVEYEIGGDYARPLGPGTLKLIGLHRFEDSDFRTVFINALDGQDATRAIFVREDDEIETIGRVEYAFTAGKRHDMQASAEYAFNVLDSFTVFEDNFTAPVEDAVRVEEDRFDARVSDSWAVSDRLTLQTSLGAEYSTLGVVAPGQEDRSFFRPKGFIAGSWKQTDRYTWRARAERGVGQLDFGTFVSTRNLTDGVGNTGNDDIKPEQFWNLSVELERTDGELLSGRISPFYRRISDPIDRVLFADGTEGSGNLDSAERYGVEGDATLLMDRLGVPGLRFELAALLQDSRIDDPLTGESRAISRADEWFYELEARYDIPGTSVALEAELFDERDAPFLRLDEFQEVYVDAPYLEAAVIFKDIAGLQLAVQVQNLLDNTIVRERDRFFGEQRRLGPVGQYERFDRVRGRRLSVELSGTF